MQEFMETVNDHEQKYRRPMQETTCTVCGKIYLAIRSKVINGSAKCCSKSCRGVKAQSCQLHCGRKPDHGGCVGGQLSPIYRRWASIKARCLQKDNSSFHFYGARGIKLCEEWKSFQVFESWAKTHGFKEHLQIDRIDGTKGYSPDNCRWVTPSQNGRNKKNNVRTSDGRLVIDVAESIGINRKTMITRLRNHPKKYEQILLNLPLVRNGFERKSFKSRLIKLYEKGLWR